MVMKKILSLFKGLISLFYPRLCVACGKVLHEKEQFFCLNCFQNLPETNFHLFDDNPLIYTFMGRVNVVNVASLLFYKKGNMTQNILRDLKYKGNKELGRFLGQYYGKKLIEHDAYKKMEVIIPIPLHTKKLKKRGYNQSEWIAMGLSETMGIPYNTTALVRTSFTETQTKKSRIDRWENVKNVFHVADENSIKGKHILVCDDVLTTGATMEAAIKQLLEVENTTVSVVTLGTTYL